MSDNAKLYVGNLNYATTNQELTTLFAEHGQVQNVNIIEGKGFGFVEMSSPAEAESVKEALNGTEFKGRNLRIDNARPPQKRRPSGNRNQRDNRGKRDYSRRR